VAVRTFCGVLLFLSPWILLALYALVYMRQVLACCVSY
jgi:hypothetical protein